MRPTHASQQVPVGDLKRPLATPTRKRISNRSTLNSRRSAIGKLNDCNVAIEPETAPTSPERAPSVTLLGSGQRTPWTGYKLDRATREAILYAEVHMTTSP